MLAHKVPFPHFVFFHLQIGVLEVIGDVSFSILLGVWFAFLAFSFFFESDFFVIVNGLGIKREIHGEASEYDSLN